MAKKYKHLIWNNLSFPVGWSFAAHKKAGGVEAKYSGVDIATPRFTLLRAGWDGVVYAMKKGAGTKDYVTIKHKGFFIEYVHVRDIRVKKGQKVKKGQIIGRTGVQDKHGIYLWLHLAWLQGDRYAHKNRVDPIPRLFPPKPKPKPKPKPDPCQGVKKELKRAAEEVSNLSKLRRVDTELIRVLKEEKSALEANLSDLRQDYDVALQRNSEIAEDYQLLKERWMKEINWTLLVELIIKRVKRLVKGHA